MGNSRSSQSTSSRGYVRPLGEDVIDLSTKANIVPRDDEEGV